MRKIFLILFVIVVAGCACESQINGGLNPAGEQEVEISFVSTSEVDSRAIIAEEDIVESLDLLIFKNNSFLYWRSAYKINNKFRATLSIDQGLDIHFFANARDIITKVYEDGELSEGDDFETVRGKIIDTNPSRFSYTSVSQIRLPMWGMLENKTVEDVPINHWGGVSLLRSVASVDVEVKEDIEDQTFLLEDIRLYFVPNKGQLAPSLANYDKCTHAINIPESPPGMQTTLTLFSDIYNPTTKSIANRLYLYDNNTDDNNRTQLPDKSQRNTRLVIGGNYKGTKCYYPVDFETEDDALDVIMRNYKYIIRINSVTSKGYANPETASEEPPVGLNVNIVKWNERIESDFYNSGQYYVGITGGKEVVLTRNSGSEYTIQLRSNIKADQITLKFSTENNGTKQDTANGIKNNRFLIEKTKDSNDCITGLVFTALEDYNTSEEITNHDALIVTSGRIQFEISIVQIDGDENDWNDGGDNGTILE